MKTARQALIEHRATFWKATDCDAWMATEAQLLAYMARQEHPEKMLIAADHDSYARTIRGVTHKDQFYA